MDLRPETSVSCSSRSSTALGRASMKELAAMAHSLKYGTVLAPNLSIPVDYHSGSRSQNSGPLATLRDALRVLKNRPRTTPPTQQIHKLPVNDYYRDIPAHERYNEAQGLPENSVYEFDGFPRSRQLDQEPQPSAFSHEATMAESDLSSQAREQPFLANQRRRQSGYRRARDRGARYV